MRRKAIIISLIIVIAIIASVAICVLSVSLEDEAKVQAVDFAQRYIKFDIDRHDYDLDVTSNDEIHYRVVGTIKRKSDLTHLHMIALLELKKSEKLWLLDTLVIDSITLYSRD